MPQRPKPSTSGTCVLNPPLTPQSPAKKGILGRSEHNRVLRQRAYQRLNELTEHAESTNFYGRIAIEIAYEHGRITCVRRKFDGTDK